MSIDALLELLERDARAEAARLVAAAQQQAQEILSRTNAETERRRAEALGRLEAAGRHAVACQTASAVRRFRELRLEERAQVLDRVLAEAGRELHDASADRYQRQLPELLRDTLRYLDGSAAVVVCRPEIAAQVERGLAQRPDVTVRAGADAAAGVLGESGDGAVVVDNTLPALLERRRAELTVALAARLEAA